MQDHTVCCPSLPDRKSLLHCGRVFHFHLITLHKCAALKLVLCANDEHNGATVIHRPGLCARVETSIPPSPCPSMQAGDQVRRFSNGWAMLLTLNLATVQPTAKNTHTQTHTRRRMLSALNIENMSKEAPLEEADVCLFASPPSFSPQKQLVARLHGPAA